MEVKRSRIGRVSQGDIYKDVEYFEYAIAKRGTIEISKIVFPLVLVLTQDCDLEQDSKVRFTHEPPKDRDKMILSVLVAPIYNAEQVYLGEHLAELGISMQSINRTKTPGKYLRENQRPRYHYLDFPPKTGLPASVIDFKHYFSVNVEYLQTRKAAFVCRVSPLFREQVSQRFASFLSRIGLPELESKD